MIAQFPSPDQKFQFTATTTMIRNDAQVISFVMYVYEFSGGAHGGESIMTYNYDVIHNKEITLDIVSGGDALFLQKLSTVSREKLRNDLAVRAEVKPESIDATMLREGTAPTSSNFSLFTLPNATSAIFYFTQYQVAAYVFGSSKISVPLPFK